MHSPSSLTSTLWAYSSAPRRISSASRWPSAMISCDDLCGAGQLALLDQESGLLLGTREDALRLLLGALDDALGLLVDALGRADLFGHRDAELVEQIEGSRLVDDHVARQRHVAAAGDHALELFDEKNDVDGTGLRCTRTLATRRDAVNGRLYGLARPADGRRLPAPSG